MVHESLKKYAKGEKVTLALNVVIYDVRWYFWKRKDWKIFCLISWNFPTSIEIPEEKLRKISGFLRIHANETLLISPFLPVFDTNCWFPFYLFILFIEKDKQNKTWNDAKLVKMKQLIICLHSGVYWNRFVWMGNFLRPNLCYTLNQCRQLLITSLWKQSYCWCMLTIQITSS